MTAAAELESFRISLQQRRAFLLAARGTGYPPGAHAVFRIRGPLDTAALRAALRQVVARQEILRTSFQRFAGMTLPVQVVTAGTEPELAVRDLRTHPGDVRARLDEALDAAVRSAWGLEGAPLLRFSLWSLAEGEHALLASLSALCADGSSLGPLLAEIAACYAAAAGRSEPPPPPPLQYVDYAGYQHQILAAEEAEEARGRWRARAVEIAAAPAVRWPAGETDGAAREPDPRRLICALPPGLQADLAAFCAGSELAPEDFLLACWQALLGRRVEGGAVVGVAVDGRRFEELQDAIGAYTTFVPVASGFDLDLPFEQWLSRVAEAVAAATEGQEAFTWENFAPRGGEGVAWLPFAFEAGSWPAEREVGETAFALLDRRTFLERSDLKLAVWSHPDGGLALELVYDAGRIDGEAASRLAEELRTLAAAALAHPGAPVGDLEIVGAEERILLARWGERSFSWSPEPVHRLFEAQARKTPDRTAVEGAGRAMTYGELNARANRLAHHLRDLGVGPETPVAILLGRSPEMLVALLAALKAGGAYVPLDPTYPRERLAFILDDTRAPVLLSEERLAAALPARPERTVLLDRDGDALPAREDDPEVLIDPGHLAYVIYTSGSTGRPKGVLVSHGNLAHSTAARLTYYTEPVARYLLASSFSFDSSVAGLFWTLAQGGALVLPRDDFQQNLGELVRFVESAAISHLLCLPGLHRVVLEQGDPHRLAALGVVIVAGEACPPELVTLHRRTLPETRLFNEYGPTEGTVWSTVFDATGGVSGERVPIGRGVGGTRLHVVSARQRAVPAGAGGELWIGGDGLARGYHDRPELTAERFVPDPFATQPGERLYRTGDQVRFLPGGDVDFQGRVDQQVKIRGYRIEIGEIEAAISRSPGVREVAVAVREEASGDKRLVAYIFPAEGERIELPGLRRRISEELPEFMVPAAWVLLREMPRTPNGKVDRRALPDPAEVGDDPDFVAPRTAAEEVLAAIWGDVLGREAVGIHASFFELGGNSLIATQLVSRVRSAFRVELPQRTLFRQPTIAGLAAELENLRRSDVRLPALCAAPPGARAVLSFQQERLWFFDQLNPGSNAYNLLYPVALTGALGVPALCAALAGVLVRHGVLRTHFPATQGQPLQVVAAAAPPPVPIVDLRGLPAAAREGEALRLAVEAQGRSFDLAHGPLFRALLLRLADRDHRLLVGIHQIVFDGWSLGVLVREFAELYRAAVEGRPPQLAELPVQYVDFALWQRGWMQGDLIEAQLAYWRSHLGERPVVAELPADRPRSSAAAARLDQRWLDLPADLTANLKVLGRKRGATLFMSLLSVIEVLLHRHTGADRILIGTLAANRNQPGIEQLIGFFVNTLAISCDLAGDPRFTDLLERVREAALGANDHQDLPFERVIEAINPGRTSGGQALFQVMFVFQNAPLPTVDLPGLSMSFPRIGGTERKAAIDLSWTAAETEEGIAVVLDYNRDLFEAATVERLLRHFETLLRGAVEDDGQPLSQLPMLAAGEVLQIHREPARPAGGQAAAAGEPVESRSRAAALRAEVSDRRSKLSAEQQALLARRLKREVRPQVPRQEIARRLEAGPAPLSFGQERLWFLDRLEPGGTAYNLLDTIRLTGALDAAALDAALREIVRRHEALATCFTEVEGQPVAVVSPVPLPPLLRVDLEGLPAGRRLPEALRLAAAEAGRPFDLAAGPLVRALLVRCAGNEHVLALVIHHLVSDAWSFSILIRELTALYAAGVARSPSPLAAPAIQYSDFAAWQRERLRGEPLDELLAVWRRRLTGAPATLELPADRARPPRPSLRGAFQRWSLPAGLTERLGELGRRQGTTPFMTLLAAWTVLLARHTGAEDLLVGTPVAGRNRSELEGLIGFLANTLVLRIDLSGDPAVRELLLRVRDVALEAQAHQDLPFEKLVETLAPERSLAHTPLFQVMLVLQNVAQELPPLPGLAVEVLPADSATAKFDLTLALQEGAQGLFGGMEYSTDLFEAATIRRLLGRFERILSGFAADQDRRLSELPLLTEEEREHLLTVWNGTADAAPAADGPCLHELFAARAARSPGATAVTFAGESLTFRELDGRADALARRLRRLGAGPGARVGLCMERSLEMVVGLLGILKSGAAYLPLDPAAPPERLAFLLADGLSGQAAPLLVTRRSLTSRLPETVARMLCLDDEEEDEAPATADPAPAWRAARGNLAYVIYTSGSTGRPKGVAVTHRNVIRLFTSTEPWFGFDESDVWTLFHSIAFDFSVWELWGALLYGGRLVVVPQEVTRSPEDFLALLARERVTVLNQTPSAFRPFAAAACAADAGLSLRQVIFGGEALDYASLAPWFERFGDLSPRLVNMYGITETTVHVTYRPVRSADLREGHRSCIGVPIPDLRLYVLDRRLCLLPAGVPGELFVGGAGLATGYLHHPELMAERFVPDPFASAPGGRLYRTGDLARRLPDGDLEYLGRSDHQVKIRGFRIELGEIETSLQEVAGVDEAVVLVREGGNGEKRLAAYVTRRFGAVDPEPAALRAHLAAKLPDYMLPATFVVLDAFPLTANGKVDRRALPAPGMPASIVGARPRDPLEEILAGLWGEVSGAAEVGVDASFFELGGHSLLATRLIARVRQTLGVELPLGQIFETPTVAGFAGTVRRALAGEEREESPPLAPVSRQGAPPLSFAQQRLWFIDQLQPGSPTYNIPAALRLEGPLRPDLLARSFTEVARRHEVLRTRFPAVAGEPVLEIDAERLLVDAHLPLVDLGGLPAEQRADEARRLAAQVATCPFDLSRDRLWRALLTRLEPTGHLLAVTLHHIVSDGWSMGVLIREVAAFYAALAAGSLPSLPELPAQYADWAAWQRRRLSGEVLETELSYWRGQLAGAALVLDLPVDRPRPAVRTPRGGSCPVWFDPVLTRGLQGLGRGSGATLFMTLLAGFQGVFARWCSAGEVSVGTPVAGRIPVETEGLIGLFVNTLVLRTDLSGDPAFRTLLGRVRSVALGAYVHQELPFEKLVEEIAPERALSHHPLFQVMLALQTFPGRPVDVAGLRMAPLSAPAGTAKFDLSLALWEEGESLCGEIEYSRDLFDPPTVLRLAGWVECLLRDAVEEPGRRLAELRLLTAAQRFQLLVEWNDTGVAPAHERCVHVLVGDQAVRRPGALAVAGGAERLSYGQLEQRAGALARRLRACGVRRGDRVGVCLERTPEMVVAFLGILKAGAAFVALDPGYPAERLRFVAADARMPALLSRGELAGKLAGHGAAVILIDEPEEGGGAGAAPLPSEDCLTLDDLAYVIYTSGSTGLPKGVEVTHRGLLNLVLWHQSAYGVTAADRASQLASAAFDASVWELWPYLAAGASVHLVAEEIRADARRVGAWLTEEGITIGFLPTPLAEQLLALDLPGAGRSLRALLTGGDRLHRSPPPGLPYVLVNHYGPTEAAVVSTVARVAPEEPAAPPIGRPIANYRVYLVGRHLEAVPAGARGELLIGGAGVARGYLLRPDLTALRFIPDPFGGEPGARLYRTGDLARHLPDGRLDFLGRTDRQVKLRGFRIELGEIEAEIARHPAVREVAAAVREDRGVPRLAAWVVPAGEPPSLAGLQGFLRERIPAYMIPGELGILEALPLTSHGKIDLEALPSPERPESTGVGAGDVDDPVEELLAGIWMEVLRRDRVSRGDNFFDLGGHSLLATQVVSRLRETLAVELPLRQVFEAPILAELARAVRAARREEGPVSPAIAPVPRPGPFPLSFAQQRLWFLAQLDPDGTAYNMPVALRLEGRLYAGLLATALSAVAQRQEVLRTIFPVVDGEPVQAILPPASRPLPLVDLRSLPESLRATVARDLAAGEAARPFDLARGPVLRCTLLRLGGESHVLLLTVHHIAGDGWSLGVLVREVGEVYRALGAGEAPRLPGLPVQVADYAVWQRGWLQGSVLERELAWWRERLAGLPPLLELPTDRPRPPVQSFRGGERVLRLGPECTGALRALARRNGATLFMALLAGLQTLLARLAAQDRLAVGTPLAGRTRLEVEPLIGCFINTMVLPADLSAAPDFVDLLGQVRETSLGAHAHQDLPFERLVEELAPVRSLAHAPLFQVMLILQNTPEVILDLPDLRVRPLGGSATTAKLDLSLALQEQDGGLAGILTYAADLFDAATMDRFAARLARLVDGAVAEPGRRVFEIPLLSADEWHQLVVEPVLESSLAPARCIHDLFWEQVAYAPEAPAVAAEEGVLSYAELGRRVRRLARRLRAAGVGPDQPVILCADRGIDLVVGLLGILEAGGAYLAVEPDLPPARLELLAEDSGAVVAVAQRPLAGSLPARLRRIFLEDQEEGAEAPEILRAAVLPGHLAYVLFTSGSTGRPKGVQVEHRHLAAYVQGVLARLALPPGASFATVSSFAADLGHTSIFAALLNGGCLHVVARERLADAATLADWMEKNPVDGLKIVPSHLAALLTAERPERLLPRRALVLGGEALPASLVERVRELAAVRIPGCRVFNHYGPTETTVGVLAGEVGDLDGCPTVPLGRPLGLTRAWVVDRHQQLVPAGVPGELWIGGPQVTRGYLGRPDLTAERFLPSPFGGAGERLYRTGDLVRRRPDGLVEFLGRIDDQVKIRGFRIELAEVEAALLALPGVREAAALVRRRGDDLSLAAVVAVATPVNASALLARLRDRLPPALVPSGLAFLDTLPRTANGKIDRGAVAALAEGLERDRAVETAEDDAADPVSPLLAGLWAELLDLPHVGPHDDFFAIGGHSLLATRVLSRVREAFSVELPLRALFEARTPRRLAALVQEARRGAAGFQAPPLVPAPHEGDVPLSFAQQRLWFLARLEPESPAYNIPMAVRLNGSLQVPALMAALRAVERRHEVLRTTFALSGGQPVQRAGAAPRLEVPVVDLVALPGVARHEELERLVRAAARRPFDLEAGPVWRAGLVRLAEREHAILITLHHIASDGWSRSILMREIAEVYGSLAGGEDPSLPSLSVQYADFAVWQRSWLRGEVLREQLDFWKGRLAGAPRRLELPTDRPRPPVQTFRGASWSVPLSPALSREMEALCREAGATPFMAFLAAWALLLGRHAGQDDVLVGSPIAGRNRREVEGLIGCFLNTLVLRIRFAGHGVDAPGFRELLGSVREMALDAFAHQDVPFERLVEELVTERDLAVSPLFQTLFVLQSAPAGTLRASGLALEPVETASGVAKFEISLALAKAPAGFWGTLEYNTDLFDTGTAERLASRLVALLEAAVADPGQRVGDLPLLLPAEQSQLGAWNDARDAPLPGLCLHELVGVQAARTPEAEALVDGLVRWTYAELVARAGGIGYRLRALGIGPEDRVAVCLERSAALVAALLGVLAAGGAYVPIDPAYPRDRRAFMLRDSGARVLVTRGALAADLPTAASRLDLDAEEIAPAANLLQGSGAGPDHLAYVIYTSGSTGRPKGVAIEHRSAAALAGWAREEFSREELSGVLAATSVCFDLSVFEIFVPLAWGGRVILAQSPLDLPALPAAAEVRLVNTVPSAAAELVRNGGLPVSVCAVNLAGEPLPATLVDRLYATGSVKKVRNLYGPSEDTTYTTGALVPRDAVRPPAIGRPLPGTRAWVVDPGGRPVPAGVVGELWIAGGGLARGYLGRPDLTAERFTPDPSGGPGERAYRTGDRVLLRPDGNLEFLGRDDQQVKIRGFRIELGEIEAALNRHAAVRETAVVVREERPGDRFLVAYVVPEGEAPSSTDLMGFLRERLPAHQVPAVFVFLDRLPLTPNGKVDRRALTAERLPFSAGTDRGAGGPRDSLELELVRIWEEVLERCSLGVRDDFFALGGHSLLAVRLLARVEQKLGKKIALARIFEGRTVERMAALLRSDRRETVSPLVLLQNGGAGTPLFWIHPAGGGVFCYMELLRHLPGWNAYGFEAPGLSGPEPPLASVAALAELYLRELRAVQPDGPYRLLGWSLGGLVAFEMAQRLREQGDEVSFLGLLDARVPVPGAPAVDDAALLLAFAQDLGLPLDGRSDAAAAGCGDLLARLLDEVKAAGLLPADFGLDEARRRLQVFRTHVAAGAAYHPRAYPGRLTVFRAAGPPPAGRGPDLGWGRLAGGGLTVHDIPGTHYTMVREPHARTLARHLAEGIGS